MSYYFINKEKDINLNNIIIGEEVMINENIKKIYIYYLDDSPKELMFNLPRTRLIYNFKNQKFDQVKIPIYPIWDKTNNFIKFFKKFEKFIKTKINLSKDFSYCLEKKDKIYTLKMNIYPNININSQIKTSLSEFKVNSEIEGIISVPYVWIKNDTWGLSLNVYQLKYIPKIEEVNINFYDDITEEPIKKIINNNKEISKGINKEISKGINNVGFKISSDILNDAMKKLKKN
jgi:hypothetical protein